MSDGTLDAAILFLVLHYQDEPARVLAEARRALAPGGRLLVVDMMPHEQRELAERMGHVWQGIGEEMLGRWMDEAGFASVRYRPLQVDTAATGPALFAAVATSRADAQAAPDLLDEDARPSPDAHTRGHARMQPNTRRSA